MVIRPKECTDEMLEFLDALREEGSVNMFGASVNLNANFDLQHGTALGILGYWMDTYDKETR